MGASAPSTTMNNKFKNPIPVNIYVKTPESFEDLDVVVSKFSKQEQEILWIGASLAFNLSNKIVTETLIKEEV